MKKKIFVTILIITLIVGCFAACGSSSSSSGSNKSTTTQTKSNNSKKTSAKTKKDNHVEKKSVTKKSSSANKNILKKSSRSSEVAKTCTITITCHNAIKHKDRFETSVAKLLPSSGVILRNTKIKVQSGDSVLDITKRTVREKGIIISVKSQTSSGTAYVEGIAGIFEFDGGRQSGWLYQVNGKKPGKGSDEYSVKSGDKIEWIYTLNTGEDV